MAQNTEITLAVVGTYNETGKPGLYTLRANRENGTFDIVDSCRVDNPSYFTFSESGDVMYCVTEKGVDDSVVSALKVNKATGSLTLLNSVPAHGSPCYIATNGKIVVTANYGGGSLSVFPIKENGALGEMSQTFPGETGGPDTIRQKDAHIHCVEFSPDGKYLYATDFSSDRILVFRVTDNGRSLEPITEVNGEKYAAVVDADSGPRHLIFDSTGKHAYLLGELSGTITVFDVDDYRLNKMQTIKADDADARGSADIHMSPDGKFVYATTRLKDDCIKIFKVDKSTGLLTPVGGIPTGAHPRNFFITDDGNFLFCACRDTGSIIVYSRNREEGSLTKIGETQGLHRPVCIKFIP